MTEDTIGGHGGSWPNHELGKIAPRTGLRRIRKVAPRPFVCSHSRVNSNFGEGAYSVLPPGAGAWAHTPSFQQTIQRTTPVTVREPVG